MVGNRIHERHEKINSKSSIFIVLANVNVRSFAKWNGDKWKRWKKKNNTFFIFRCTAVCGSLASVDTKWQSLLSPITKTTECRQVFHIIFFSVCARKDRDDEMLNKARTWKMTIKRQHSISKVTFYVHTEPVRTMHIRASWWWSFCFALLATNICANNCLTY